MATATVLAPQAVTTILNYHLEPERGGEIVWCPGTVRDKRRPHEHAEVTVHNIRGYEESFTLDKQGFAVGPFDTSVADVQDDAEFKGQYYQDVVAHLKKVTGASKVLPVVHITRRRQWDEVAEAEKDLPDNAPVTAPTANRSVHVDQSYFGAELVRDSKLEELPASEAERLKKVRWAIINLWRPLNHVTRDNMALCDARTVAENELAAVYADLPEELRNAKTGYNFAAKSRSEAWEVKANTGAHKWYYASGMNPNEALLIKQFDSKPHGVARRTPHCAFSAKEDHGPVRQSIEVRCLCFWEDQPQEEA
ncbi:hypothetical protein AYO20_04212 [Fonsecaea nubica]|uniref:Uncharacterized protein n=1 Tax=Fonsecaea nubica TaxID=856822 RepID=A0A178D4C2_9EURO|nr:hypothetical protein AYO20_04212 [Fonsecaea nubica]OAL36596.1 hypothetical protein AYO20_04212 [Fonsecaea nubica]